LHGNTSADSVRYYVLVNSKEWEGNSDVKAFCQLLLQRTLRDEDKYQIGLSKIFFRAGMVAQLEALRTARLNALVTLVQKNVRRRIAYKQYQDLRKKTITIQAWWRGVLGRRLAEETRKHAAAVLIQRASRAYLQRRSYQQTRQAVVTIQSGK
jgi:myosin-5